MLIQLINLLLLLAVVQAAVLYKSGDRWGQLQTGHVQELIMESGHKYTIRLDDPRHNHCMLVLRSDRQPKHYLKVNKDGLAAPMVLFVWTCDSQDHRRIPSGEYAVVMYSGPSAVDLGTLRISNPMYHEPQAVDERVHAIFTSKPDLQYGFRTQEEPRRGLVVPLLVATAISLVAARFAKYMHAVCRPRHHVPSALSGLAIVAVGWICLLCRDIFTAGALCCAVGALLAGTLAAAMLSRNKSKKLK